MYVSKSIIGKSPFLSTWWLSDPGENRGMSRMDSGRGIEVLKLPGGAAVSETSLMGATYPHVCTIGY